MSDVVTDFERMPGLVGVPVAEHVDRPGVEVLGVRRQVTDVGLGMTAGSVQQYQDRLARLAGMQVAGPHTPGIQVPLRERNALEIAPDALELGYPLKIGHK